LAVVNSFVVTVMGGGLVATALAALIL